MHRTYAVHFPCAGPCAGGGGKRFRGGPRMPAGAGTGPLWLAQVRGSLLWPHWPAVEPAVARGNNPRPGRVAPATPTRRFREAPVPTAKHAPAAASPAALPALTAQAERLIALGLHETAGLTPDAVHAFAESAGPLAGPGTLLALHPDRVPASVLAPLVRHDDRPGFVVTDMTDVDAFAPVDTATPPDAALYVLTGVDRGDHLADWSPDEALPALGSSSRTPLLLTEGLHWLLQQPGALERNHCFMTLGSRLRKPGGALDSRTPAVWISNGTGRDGRERRNAPKVGWCWAGNRHTWLGFASATGRRTAAG